MHQDKALAKLLPRAGADFGVAVDVVVGQESAAADAELGVAGPGRTPLDHLDPRPDPARVLPAPTRTAQPLPKNRPRRHQAPLRFAGRADQGLDLARGPHQARDDPRQQRGRDRQARALGDVVHLAHEFQAQPRFDEPGEHVGQALARALQPRRHNARGNHRCLQQPQVVLGKIEHLGQRGHVGLALQVHARQAQDRAVDDAQVDLDGRAGLEVAAANAQVHREVQHPRPFRKIHPQEEDVAPPAVRNVHAHRGALGEDRKRIARRGPAAKLRPDPQRMIDRVPHAEHPLVAAHRAHAAAHLVGQRLKAQAVICLRQRAGHRLVRPLARLCPEEDIDGFLEPAAQQVGVAVERDKPARGHASLHGEMEPVDGIQEKKRAHSFIQVAAGAAKRIQLDTLGQQLIARCIPRKRIHRAIAAVAIG